MQAGSMPAAPSKSHRQVGLALVAIVLFGAFLRMRAMDLPFWFDEAFCWRISQSGWRELVTRVGNDNHSPLYFSFLKLWTGVLGTSLHAMRSSSLVFSLAGVVAAFFLTRKLCEKGPRADAAGLLAALFFAVHPYHVYVGAELRMYGLAMLLVLLSTLTLVVALQAQEPSGSQTRIASRWLLYGLCSAAAIYAHYFVLFLVGAQAIVVAWIFLRGRSAKEPIASTARSAWIGFATCALAFLPWVPTFLVQRARTYQSFWAPKLDDERALHMLVRGLLPLPHTPALWVYGALTLLILACSAAMLIAGPRWAGWITSFVLISVGTAAALSFAGTNLLQSMYLYLPMMLLLVAGAATIAESRSRVALGAGIALALALLVYWGAQSFALPRSGQDADLTAVLAYIGEARPPDEPVIADSYDYFAIRYYLRDLDGWQVYGHDGRVDSFNGGALVGDDDRVVSQAGIAALRGRGVWVIENGGGFGTRRVEVPTQWRPGKPRFFGPVRVVRYEPN
jgi:uncharacterized membrane protein